MPDYVTSPDEMERLSLQDQLLQPALDRVLDALVPVAPAAALDLGCGTAVAWAPLRGRWPQVLLQGVERNDHHVEKARQQGNSVIHGDVMTTPLPPNQDLVLARFLLRHLPDPAALVARMAQAVRPGGQVLLIDADDGAFTFSPEPFAAAGTTFAALADALAKRHGVDHHIGRRLPDLLASAGLLVEGTAEAPICTGPACSPATFARLLQPWLDPAINGRPPAACADLQAALTAWAQTPGAQAAVPVFVAVGRRP